MRMNISRCIDEPLYFVYIYIDNFMIFKHFIFIFPGITRLPVLEGEVSHVEIPRTNSSLGITIVGGADTPLVRNLIYN